MKSDGEEKSRLICDFKREKIWWYESLLGSAGFALSRSSKTDIIVAYFLQNKIYDMLEINDVLEAYGQPVFG